MDFKDILRQLRKENNLTQKELAKNIDTTQGAIYFWEKGTEPSAGQLLKLSNFFNVSVDYLLGNTDDFGNYQQPKQKEELTPSERELLEMYRVLSVEGKGQAQALVKSVKEYETAQRKKSGVKLG